MFCDHVKLLMSADRAETFAFLWWLNATVNGDNVCPTADAVKALRATGYDLKDESEIEFEKTCAKCMQSWPCRVIAKEHSRHVLYAETTLYLIRDSDKETRCVVRWRTYDKNVRNLYRKLPANAYVVVIVRGYGEQRTPRRCSGILVADKGRMCDVMLTVDKDVVSTHERADVYLIDENTTFTTLSEDAQLQQPGARSREKRAAEILQRESHVHT